jgi:hypothetical protein
MPHIILSYRKKNPVYGLDYGLVEYALHVNYIYALAFLLGFSTAIFLLIREKRRLTKLASKEKIAELRGGSDEADETNLKFLKTLQDVAYLQFLANPIVCLEPGHYEVVDSKILKILLSILGPNGIYEPRVISPGLWIMAYVIDSLQKQKMGKLSSDVALDVIKSTILKNYGQITPTEHIRSIIRNWGFQLKVNITLVVIGNILNRITLRLSPDIMVALFFLNVLQFLAVGIGLGTVALVGIGPFLGFEIVMLQQLTVKLLSASLATKLFLTAAKPLICAQMLQALPSNSEYLMPAPTTAPRNDRVALKDKIILYARKKDEQEKILYINVPAQRDMLCESREFAKTLEGKILEASDLKDQASIPTYIQEECTKFPGTSIPVTQKIKTLSDIKQHDEKPVREKTDRSLTLLEVKDIVEDGNWYGAEQNLRPIKVNDQPPTKQVPRLRGSNPSRRKQTMTIRDLPKDDIKENCFVQEDTQRVSKLAEKAEKISHQDNYDDDYLI